ncbi:hypothetical protein V5799_008973 [Amblyomma americanum]|uniref:Uncharacterized protein n=1 Tax=Amblyomma americanum TaxID=6943 RepID=A0AAQ4FD53_AMBAM
MVDKCFLIIGSKYKYPPSMFQRDSSENSTPASMLSKGEPTTALDRCCSVSVPLLVLLALVGIVLFLLFINVSDLKRLFETNNTTTPAEDTGDGSYESCAWRWGFYVPTEAQPGTDTHTGPLPGDVVPLHYAITMTLCGTSLGDPALKVTGRVEVLFKAKVSTSKLVLKAHPERIREIKVSLLDTSAPACAAPKGRKIESVTFNSPFLIVAPDDELAARRPYTVTIDYAYDSTAPNGPIALSPT